MNRIRPAAGIAGLVVLGLIISSRVVPDRVGGQEPWRQYADDYTAIENVLADLYRACSFSPGNECDWDRIRRLCHPMAVFFQPPNRGTNTFRPFDLEGFIQFFKEDIERFNMRATGFHERLGRHETTSFGRVAHSYVVFEIRQDPAAENPMQRGVDSISLVNHEGRWWVSSIDTDFEFPGFQDIPERILPGGDGGR